MPSSPMLAYRVQSFVSRGKSEGKFLGALMARILGAIANRSLTCQYCCSGEISEATITLIWLLIHEWTFSISRMKGDDEFTIINRKGIWLCVRSFEEGRQYEKQICSCGIFFLPSHF